MYYRYLPFFLLALLAGCQSAQPPAATPVRGVALKLPDVTRAEAWECVNCQEQFTQQKDYVRAVVWTGTRVKDNSPVARLRTDVPSSDYRYAVLSYATERGVGRGNDRYLSAYAVGENGDTTTAPLLPLGEGVRGELYIPVGGLGRVREVGILKTNGGNTYARTTREKIRFYGVTFVSDVTGKPGRGEAADDWLARQVAAAKPGDVLDFRGDTFLLTGSVLLRDKNDLTIRGGVFYAAVPRFDNRRRRDDFFRLSDVRDISLEGIEVYGTRYGDYTAELVAGQPFTGPHWISRHYEPGHGLVNRLDISGRGRGVLRLFTEGSDRPFLTTSLNLEDRAVPVYFQLPDRNARLRIESTFARATVSIYGRVKHVYESEFSSGIYVTGGCENVSISGVHVENVMGDGLQVDRNARNTRVDGLTVVGASRQGASVNGGIDTRLENVRLENTGRAGLDVEPYSEKDRVDGLVIRNLVTGNHNFTSFIANNWGQVFGLDLDGLESFGEMDGTWLGGANGGTIRNVRGYNFNFEGVNCRIDGLEVTGSLTVRSGRPYEKDSRLVSGNNRVSNFVLNRINSSSAYILRTGEDGSNTFTDGVLSAKRHALVLKSATTTAYLRGNGQLTAVRVEDYERYFPNMILDGRRTTPLRRAPSIYAEIYPRFAKSAGEGKLRPGKTYYYRLGVVPRGQPLRLLAEQSVTLPAGTNSLGIPVKKLADPENGYVYHTIYLYRGTAPGRYDVVYRLEPETAACGLNNNIDFRDTGDRLYVNGGNTTNSRFFGYDIQEGGRVILPALPAGPTQK